MIVHEILRDNIGGVIFMAESGTNTHVDWVYDLSVHYDIP